MFPLRFLRQLRPRFPSCVSTVSDYYQFDDLMTPEEHCENESEELYGKGSSLYHDRVLGESKVSIPRYPKFGMLRIAGGTIKLIIALVFVLFFSLWWQIVDEYLGYGCPGLSIIANAVATAELTRHSVDLSNKSRNTCLLWHKFVVKKNAPGLAATEIENKIGLRIVQNGDIALKKFLSLMRIDYPVSILSKIQVLAVSRIMVAWQPIGISMGIYDMCHRYLKERKQFGVPLTAFQINQQKLVQMLGNIQAMIMVGWRLCKLYEMGKMTAGQANLGKITLRARETAAIGLELLGGNRILANFLVAKAFCDLEPIYTYEGTYDVNLGHRHRQL